MTSTETIIVALLASNGLFALLQFLVSRYDQKKNVKGKLAQLEKDTLRTQLLLMLLMKPTETQEILTLGEHYFVKLKGDWYMTSIFNKWVNKYIPDAKPEWFNKEESK